MGEIAEMVLDKSLNYPNVQILPYCRADGSRYDLKLPSRPNHTNYETSPDDDKENVANYTSHSHGPLQDHKLPLQPRIQYL